MELQAHKEIQGLKDQPEPRGQLAPRELLVQTAPLVQQELPGQTEQLVLQEPRVVKVLQDLKALLESIPLQAVTELSRLLELPVPKARLEKQAPLAPRELPVPKARLEKRVQLAPRVLPARQDLSVQAELARPLGQLALKVRLAKQVLRV